MEIEKIAMICHEANRAYCQAIGDDSQVSWEDAPQSQRDSVISGVEFMEDNRYSTTLDIHDEWCINKAFSGWVYGKEKDDAKMTHPCLVDYYELPDEKKVKVILFEAAWRALTSYG